MAIPLSEVLEAARSLTPLQRIELVQALEREPQPGAAYAFWSGRSLETLARIQGVVPVHGIADLRADFWPDDESADDAIAYLQEQRHHDR